MSGANGQRANRAAQAAGVNPNSPNNGANVQQWQYGGGPNQLWRLVER